MNTAFVDGELNKTVSGGTENNNWNLLDDPTLLREDEEVLGHSHILDLSEKEIKKHSNKNLPNAESAIQPEYKPYTATTYAYNQQKVVDDDEEDLQDLCDFFHGKKPLKSNKK